MSCIFLFAAAIIGRLVYLQILQGDFYAALAEGQQSHFVTAKGDRGKIFFQNHELPLATQKTNFFLYASPSEIPEEEKEKTAEILSERFLLEKVDLLAELSKDSLYGLIKDKLAEEEAEAFKALSLKGIYVGKDQVRDYPEGEFASHILGFVNKDGRGQYGLEEYWNDYLTGKESVLKAEKGPLGYLFSNSDNAAITGFDLISTIDYNIQYFAEKLLQNAKKDLNIEGGTIIVIKPQSGEVLALAELSNFDPNKYYQESLISFQTDAIQKVFEPGSVFKPLTMAASLDEGKITPHTTYQDPGVIEIDGWPIYNYDKRTYQGNITMTEVLEKSINSGAVFAEAQLGNNKFMEYVEKFGIFEKTGIDLAGEIRSQNKEFKKGYKINFATASFGQGIEMTPIQLVRAFSAIANGGKLANPYLIKEAVNGQESLKFNSEAGNAVISPETASKLTAMLVSVVENGFGKKAQIPGYYVAGKTGTAQISLSALGMGKSGYSEKTWQSFIGFAPAFAPEFIILVKLNNPETKTAEYSAVPMFRELAKYIIDYYQIPPDYTP